MEIGAVQARSFQREAYCAFAQIEEKKRQVTYENFIGFEFFTVLRTRVISGLSSGTIKCRANGMGYTPHI